MAKQHQRKKTHETRDVSNRRRRISSQLTDTRALNSQRCDADCGPRRRNQSVVAPACVCVLELTVCLRPGRGCATAAPQQQQQQTRQLFIRVAARRPPSSWTTAHTVRHGHICQWSAGGVVRPSHSDLERERARHINLLCSRLTSYKSYLICRLKFTVSVSRHFSFELASSLNLQPNRCLLAWHWIHTDDKTNERTR